MFATFIANIFDYLQQRMFNESIITSSDKFNCFCHQNDVTVTLNNLHLDYLFISFVSSDRIGADSIMEPVNEEMHFFL